MKRGFLMSSTDVGMIAILVLTLVDRGNASAAARAGALGFGRRIASGAGAG